MTWFKVHWARTALPIAFVLLVLSPWIFKSVGLGLFVVFLQLPVYMIHQHEEHAHGCFKEFVNQLLGDGKEVLTDEAIFWINILLVWALDIVSLYLAAFVHPGFGLIAIALTIFNGLVHLIMAAVLRRYNPGVWTSAFLFLPLGGYGYYALVQAAHPSWGFQALGWGVAVLVHAGIIVHVRRRIHAIGS